MNLTRKLDDLCCSGSLLRPKQLDWLNVPRKIFLRPSAATTVVIRTSRSIRDTDYGKAFLNVSLKKRK